MWCAVEGGRNPWSEGPGAEMVVPQTCKQNRTNTKQNEKFSKTYKIKEFATCDPDEKFPKTENMQKFAKYGTNKQKYTKPELPIDPAKRKESQKDQNPRTKPRMQKQIQNKPKQKACEEARVGAKRGCDEGKEERDR